MGRVGFESWLCCTFWCVSDCFDFDCLVCILVILACFDYAFLFGLLSGLGFDLVLGICLSVVMLLMLILSLCLCLLVLLLSLGLVGLYVGVSTLTFGTCWGCRNCFVNILSWRCV